MRATPEHTRDFSRFIVLRVTLRQKISASVTTAARRKNAEVVQGVGFTQNLPSIKSAASLQTKTELDTGAVPSLVYILGG